MSRHLPPLTHQAHVLEVSLISDSLEQRAAVFVEIIQLMNNSLFCIEYDPMSVLKIYVN